jgi:hypothetical protein
VISSPYSLGSPNVRCSPDYLRCKSGIGEGYAAGIFKSTEEQNLPLKKYVKALPDLTFFTVRLVDLTLGLDLKTGSQSVMNDLLSFYKEERAGETYNFVHLRTRVLSSSGARGSGVSGEWTVTDTIQLLCDEIIEAVRRIDGLLRLEECERKMKGEAGLSDVDDEDLDIAKQWRGWRDGFISWHLDSQRYKLDFLKPVLAGSPSSEVSRLTTTSAS